MRSAEVLGHGAVLEGLWNAARAGRLAHAFGFFGPAGVGKFLAAERLALGLVCAHGPGAPCLVCGPCRRALAGSHPDVLALDPVAAEAEEIYTSWITPREEPDKDKRPPGGVALEEFLALRPLEGGWRVVLVREADLMKVYAQNALLKTLEEPGADVLIVLVTAQPDQLLPTVKSRLIAASFAPLTAESVRAVLSREGVPAEEISDLARLARGSPGRALDLARWRAADIWALQGGVLAGRVDPLEASAALGALEGGWSGKTPAARARARARVVLDLTIEALGDVLRARAGVPAERLAHPDLTRAAQGVSDVQLEGALERALEARQDVGLNLDPVTAVERVLLALAPRTTARDARPR